MPLAIPPLLEFPSAPAPCGSRSSRVPNAREQNNPETGHRARGRSRRWRRGRGGRRPDLPRLRLPAPFRLGLAAVRRGGHCFRRGDRLPRYPLAPAPADETLLAPGLALVLAGRGTAAQRVAHPLAPG